MDGQRRAAELIAEAGGTWAGRAGVRVVDRPAALWQLLVFSNLVSARVPAEVAASGTAALVAAGAGTPLGMLELSWQQRKDALLAGRYQHFADGTATRLGDCARLAEDEYDGDLRALAAAAQHRPARTRALLQRFPGIGPAGADAFCREAQAVWPYLRPALDGRVLKGAERIGLPTVPEELAALVDPSDLHLLADALVRVGQGEELAQRAAATV